MDRDWFYSLLREQVATFDDLEAEARLENFRRANPGFDAKEFVRRWIEFRLRQTGVVYGTPLTSEGEVTGAGRSSALQRRAVFLAILRVEADLAMEVGCTVSHCTRGNIRVCELLVCFALLCRQFRLADRVHARLTGAPEDGPMPEPVLRLARKIGARLVQRAYGAGNPLIGLPIYNSFNYSDAKTLGRLSVTYFEHGLPDRPSAKRVLSYQDEERRALMQALLGLSLADRPLLRDSRQVVREQIKASGLPWRMRRQLRRMLSHPGTPLEVAATSRSERLGDFLLEQVILGALLDGEMSERESMYIGDLAGWLMVTPAQLAEREAQVLDFYTRHKAYLDAFQVATAVRTYRSRLLDRLQRSIVENLGVIVKEIRGTGELAELLVRASRGERLSDAERKQMRRQLLDILRTIPSLAIFTLPFGAVLLPLVFKFLPDGLKPSSAADLDRQRKARKESGEDEQD